MIFPDEFTPKKLKNFNIYKSRKRFMNKKNNNLIFLLKKRFIWMKKYIKNKKNIYELGSGNGASKEILNNTNIILTDIQKYSWINKKIDMRKVNLGNKLKNKVDVFIINHALHHCSNPHKLLNKLSFYLKKNGLILINDPELSFFFKLFLYLLNHEGWSSKLNVFDSKKDIFKSDNPWKGNNAVAKLLFKNEFNFLLHFPQYKILKNELSEFFIFLNSGGVVAECFHIPMNNFILSLFAQLDRFLVFLFPSIFALNRSVVLKKIK